MLGVQEYLSMLAANVTEGCFAVCHVFTRTAGSVRRRHAGRTIIGVVFFAMELHSASVPTVSSRFAPRNVSARIGRFIRGTSATSAEMVETGN